MARRIRKAMPIELFSIMMSDKKEMVPEIKIVAKKILTTHLIVFSRSRLAATGSFFAKKDPSFKYFFKNGSRQDKSYGLGRVVFHRGEPAVAAQAVSI